MENKPACNPNTVTGQNRVIRKKGDLNGAGKGDIPRPMSISKKEYEKRWDLIFGKKNKKKSKNKALK